MSNFFEKQKVKDREAAKLTGFSVQTLRNWRCKGKGPIYFKVGKSVLYDVDDLEEFMNRHRIITENNN